MVPPAPNSISSGWAPMPSTVRSTHEARPFSLMPWGHVPGASALVEARQRLGPEPLKVLFATAARPLATPATRGAWYRHWRVMVVDGTCLDVPDSPANQALGRAKSGRGEGVGAFPMVRVVGLVEAAPTRSSTPS